MYELVTWREISGRPDPLSALSSAAGSAGVTPRQGLTPLHFSAQPKPCLTQKHTPNTPSHPFTPPNHLFDNPSTHPLYHKTRLR